MYKKLLSTTKPNTSTIGFQNVLTTLPVTQFKKVELSLEADHSTGIMHELARKYTESTGITITNEYILHIFHIDEILKWEETKEAIGPYFTSVITEGKGDPLTYISSLLATARVRKNIIIIEVDNKETLSRIKDEALKFTINSTAIFID